VDVTGKRPTGLILFLALFRAGAGNSFLGGLAAGLEISGGNVLEGG